MTINILRVFENTTGCDITHSQGDTWHSNMSIVGGWESWQAEEKTNRVEHMVQKTTKADQKEQETPRSQAGGWWATAELMEGGTMVESWAWPTSDGVEGGDPGGVWWNERPGSTEGPGGLGRATVAEVEPGCQMTEVEPVWKRSEGRRSRGAAEGSEVNGGGRATTD